MKEKKKDKMAWKNTVEKLHEMEKQPPLPPPQPSPTFQGVTTFNITSEPRRAIGEGNTRFCCLEENGANNRIDRILFNFFYAFCVSFQSYIVAVVSYILSCHFSYILLKIWSCFFR